MENLREAIKERVRFYTELIKILWLLVLGVGGGTAGLFLKGIDSLKAFILFGAGIFITSYIETCEGYELFTEKTGGERMIETLSYILLLFAVAMIAFVLITIMRTADQETKRIVKR